MHPTWHTHSIEEIAEKFLLAIRQLVDGISCLLSTKKHHPQGILPEILSRRPPMTLP